MAYSGRELGQWAGAWVSVNVCLCLLTRQMTVMTVWHQHFMNTDCIIHEPIPALHSLYYPLTQGVKPGQNLALVWPLLKDSQLWCFWVRPQKECDCLKNHKIKNKIIINNNTGCVQGYICLPVSEPLGCTFVKLFPVTMRTRNLLLFSKWKARFSHIIRNWGFKEKKPLNIVRLGIYF